MRCLLVFALMIAVPVSHAVEFKDRTVQEREQLTLEQRAAEWQITKAEWRRYTELMRGARGIWTPNADPLLALGSHAKTESERRRFAELYVAREFARVEGELAFQRAVNQAWSRLYPTTPRVKTVGTRPSQTLGALLENSTAGRYGIVVEPDCAICDDMVRDYVSRVETDTTHVPVDFFVRVPDGEDRLLQIWATRLEIPVGLTTRGRITVNHGASYSGAVPQLYVQSRGGQWRSLD